MNKVFVISFVLLFSYGFVSAQEKPFEPFIDAVKNEKGGFSGNKQHLSRIFDQERRRLGENFQPELWKYLENDADKHFWVGSFLTSTSYLHGNLPMPELAVQIYQRAIVLLESKNDKRSLGRTVTMLRHLAVLSKLSDKQDDALQFRDRAETISDNNAGLEPFISFQTTYNACVYNNIEQKVLDCRQDLKPKERIINAGWMNSRATNFVQPRYPANIKNPRPAAKVDVKILTDIDGNVTSAEIIRGPAEFHTAAINAARLLKFPPTLLSGVPTKVSGWVSFEFKP